MDNKLYKMMNWPEIESIIYSECDHPHEILGKHSVQGGTLIQCFFPGAISVLLKAKGAKENAEMQEADEEGFFAYWTSDKNVHEYEYIVTYEDKTVISPENYIYLPKFDKNINEKFYAGILYDMYDCFGAHETTYKELSGVTFTVYAPMAERVSVVGDFNSWDGRVNQMSRLGESGIFSIFLPGIKEGALYKYEIKLKNGLTYLKRDPFSFLIEDNENHASIVEKDEFFSWSDAKFMAKEKSIKVKNRPLSFGEIVLKNFIADGKPLSESLKDIIDYIRRYDYDCVVFDNLSKNDDTGELYSLFALYGFIKSDIKYLVNGLHDADIPVIFTLDLSSFTPDNEGLKGFDGRKLYEAINDFEIENRITFDFTKKYVRNYVISSAFYYIKAFHADGFVLRGTDRILYLNYMRGEQDYVPNMFGGPENHGGEEFIKHLNSVLHKKNPEFITIAGDSLNSNNLTISLEEEGFGFDYKFDNHLHADMRRFFSRSSYDRTLHYTELTNVLINAYCEEFILLLPTRDYGEDESILIEGYPGNIMNKYANFRLMLTSLYVVPGRKCLPFTKFNDGKLTLFLKDLNKLYKECPALNELDNKKEGFEWLDTTDPEKSSVTFLRKGYDDTLLVTCNFSEKDRVIVIKTDDNAGYKEIFNSHETIYGGDLEVSPKPVLSVFPDEESKHGELKFKLKPLTIYIYKKL